MWMIWLLVANVGVFVVEYSYRSGQFASFWLALPYIAVPIIFSQCGLYYGFRMAPSLFAAGAAFSLVNVALRIVNTYRLHETLNMYNWFGVAFLAASVLLLKVK